MIKWHDVVSVAPNVVKASSGMQTAMLLLVNTTLITDEAVATRTFG